MTAPLIHHEAIRASAGSGKTFALAHRYIQLLAAGVDPSRIIAITFSRKAAGEIFVSIVDYLRKAADQEDAATETAERIGQPDLKSADFLVLLRRFVDQLHRLHISTIDSFTVGILRAFPMELGISPAFDLMDNGSVSAARARAQALARFFEDMNRRDADRDELIEAFKQATFGRETKTFARDFDTFVAEFQSFYKLLPFAEAWGDPDRIWPDGNPWLSEEPPDAKVLLDTLRQQVAAGNWDNYALGKWNEFVEALPGYWAGNSFSSIKYVAERLFAAIDDLQCGRAEMKFNRKVYTCDAPLADTLWRVVQHMMHARLRSSVERTRGVFRLLHQFEHMYDTQIRRMGRLTFDDAQYVIQRGGQPLSREADEPARLYIDYRLDSGLDHWLIDEFQDTSDLQWDVFRNLADEVLQDAEGRRSFFFVGDVKQAIYGWRGGNHKLFSQILEQYGDRIQTQGLHVSFRSTQPVLDVVNRVCGSLPEPLESLISDQWQPFWAEHKCADRSRAVSGYAGLIEAQGDAEEDEIQRYRACGDILKELDPLSRGLSVGILVRRNKVAIAVANEIRSMCPDIPIAVEGQSEIGDNPVVRVLLSVIRYAAHPGNTLAFAHVRMSPLREWIESPRVTPATLLRALYEQGYQACIREWGRELNRCQALDGFGAARLRQMTEAAADFDALGQRDPDEFVAFIEGYSFPEQAVEAGVRVMTVHKSKGLGFDVVLLPDLPDGVGLHKARQELLHIARDPEGQPAWALLSPEQPICNLDDVLRKEQEEHQRDDCFENVCALYVALTRAKRGLYMITSPPPQKTTSLNWSGMLRLQLAGALNAPASGAMVVSDREHGVVFETGQRDWFMDVQRSPIESGASPATSVASTLARSPSLRRRLVRVQPSSRAEGPRAAHLFFMPTVNRSLELGTAVHGLFEQIEWSDTISPQAAIAAWRKQSGVVDEEAEEHFRKAMLQSDIRKALSRPHGVATVWREQAFEAVLDEEWVTGTFDRVVIVRDAGGAICDAVIQDFKTNDVPDDPSALQAAAEPYRGQLQLYAQALSRLIGFPQEHIRACLLFTRVGRVVEIG